MSVRKIALLAACAVLSLGGCTRRDVVRDVVKVAAQPPAPHLVSLDAAAVSSVVAAGAPGELYARVHIHVAVAPRSKRTPVNLALAIDTSGSMEGDAIAQARRACDAVVDALADGDRLAIATFDSHARVLVPSTRLDAASRAVVHARIREMRAYGTTDMQDGLQLALGQVLAFANSENISRLVLMSDGVPNEPAAVLPLAQQAAAQHIAITTLGLGLDYDETLMGRIADAGGGKFHYVQDASAVAALFKDEVLRTQRLAGRGAELELTAGPGVQIQEAVGYASARVGRGLRVAIGDLVEGEDRDLAVRLTVPARAPGVAIELFDAEILYQDAVVNGGALTADGFLAVKTSDKPDVIQAGYHPEVDRAAAQASVSSLVLQAIAMARGGQLEPAKKLVDQAEAIATERGRALGDDKLAARAAEMKKLRESLPSLVPPVTPPQLVGPERGREKPAAAPMPAPIPARAAETVRELHARAQADLH